MRKFWSTVAHCLRHARRMAFLKNGSLLFAGRAVHLSIFKHGKTVAFCKHEQFLFLWWILYLARRAELVDVHIGRVVTISAEIRYHLIARLSCKICWFIHSYRHHIDVEAVWGFLGFFLLCFFKCQTKYFDNSPKLSLVSLFWHT